MAGMGLVVGATLASAGSKPVVGVATARSAGVVSALPGMGLLDPISSLGSAIAKLAARAVFALFTTSARQAATWVVGQVLHVASTGSSIELGRGSWFAGTFPQVVPLFGLVLLPLALAGTIGAVLRQDPRRLARVWLVGVPVGAGAGTAVYALVRLALLATDELCGLLHPASAVATITLSAGEDLAVAPELVQALVAVVILVGGLLLWFELVLRAASVYLALFFVPLAMATLLWPAVAGAAKRFVELLAVLVLAKLVIVGALVVGAGALGAEPGGVGASITGAAVLLLAAFAPYAVLRLVPIVELGAAAQLEGLSRRPLRAAESVPTQMLSHANQAGMLFDQLQQSPTGGLSSTPAPRLDLPEHPTGWVLGDEPGGTATAPGAPGPDPASVVDLDERSPVGAAGRGVGGGAAGSAGAGQDLGGRAR